ncbi:MAG: phosphoglycerate kinase [bacterium]|nr:phosphoglycerate kinase [bacterium]
MKKQNILDIPQKLHNKKIIMRVDFNVPLSENGNITNDKRIVAAIPTINYLLEQDCAVILISHLGRPKGVVTPQMSLAPIATYLKNAFSNHNVFMADDCIGTEVKEMANSLKSGEILLLENLRFHQEETNNDPSFAQELASLADFFVQDAFGAVHRVHASTAGITKYLPSASGLLIKKEIDYLGDALSTPQKPFIAILGGAKVSDKINVIQNLLPKVDSLIIGGAMAYTFLKAQNINVANSRVEEDNLDLARNLLKEATAKNVKLLLPIDHISATDFAEDAKPILSKEVTVPEGTMALDIGPKTAKIFKEEIINAKTVINNGPMGVFEFPAFAKGTLAIAEAIATATANGAVTIVGGGDSASAVKKAGVESKISHVSTGGGASLEFLEGKVLPGIDSLTDK